MIVAASLSYIPETK